MINNDCLYCNLNDTQKELMIKVCDLSVSTLFLFKEQTYKGRCVVAYKDHARELYELEPEELLRFMQDVNRVAKAIKETFQPAKINYGVYSDKLPHLHFHLAPKYIDGEGYGATFAMNPRKTYLTENEYDEMIKLIKSNL
ncbi:MAG: HIT domain-containing protein [Paludibacteraceae bacterium]